MKNFHQLTIKSENLDGQDIVFDLDGTLIEGDIGETLFYHSLLAVSMYARSDEKWSQPFSGLDPMKPIPVRGESAQLLYDYQTALAEGAFEKAYTRTAIWLESFPREEIELLLLRLLAAAIQPVRMPCRVYVNGTSRDLQISYGVRVKADMRVLLQTFREQGARLWIVSASPQVVCELVGREFHIPPHNILGVQASADGQQVSRFPWGAGKVRVLREAGVTQPYFAFGDGEGDIEMLSLARYPVVIANGSASLLQIARQKDWWVY